MITFVGRNEQSCKIRDIKNEFANIRTNKDAKAQSTEHHQEKVNRLCCEESEWNAKQ